MYCIILTLILIVNIKSFLIINGNKINKILYK